ncbi:MAG: hypothetical protein AUJ85_00515 [Elusimicrobia bacterium CG1_02_37_114]|nr:MAG: hypothetical protein AUJ85_00515 [Elusimicrobia bacterium CG1_02_37_114]
MQFLISQEDIVNNKFTIKGPEARHLIKVLRAVPYEKIRLFDGKGKIYSGEITTIKRDVLSGKILSKIPCNTKKFKLRLFVSLIKNERFRLLLEKVTEVGVNEIIPVITSRTVFGIPKDRIDEKHSRWQRVILSAVKQCCCEKIPEILKPIAFSDIFSCIKENEITLILYEHEEKTTVREALSMSKPESPILNLIIGPEGGFTEGEVDYAKKHGFIPVTLGNNILRAETAAVVGCALINYEILLQNLRV